MSKEEVFDWTVKPRLVPVPPGFTYGSPPEPEAKKQMVSKAVQTIETSSKAVQTDVSVSTCAACAAAAAAAAREIKKEVDADTIPEDDDKKDLKVAPAVTHPKTK